MCDNTPQQEEIPALHELNPELQDIFKEALTRSGIPLSDTQPSPAEQ